MVRNMIWICDPRIGCRNDCYNPMLDTVTASKTLSKNIDTENKQANWTLAAPKEI